MKIKYRLTYLNDDGTPWYSFLSFNSDLELNDYIAKQEKFNRIPVEVVVV